MKRLLVSAALVAAIVVIDVQPAAPAGDTRGPACANITNGNIFYSLEGVISADVFLATPTCSYVTYTFSVYDTSGNLLASTSTYASCDPEIPGGGCAQFTVDLGASGPLTVCVGGDTRIRGHVADHAPDIPDASCSTLVPTMSVARGGSPAQGFH
jgi:hypothetical protein